MEYVIEVEGAAAEPERLRLKDGRIVGPFHVGAKGKWRICGAGVADKHAFLYFDGTQLFLQSVSEEDPALAAGDPLPCEWVPIAAPCEISLGGARLRYDALDAEFEVEIEDSDTQDEPLVPMPASSAPSAPPGAGPFGRPTMGSDPTRVVPIDELHAKRRAKEAAKRMGIAKPLDEPSSGSAPAGLAAGFSVGSSPPSSGRGTTAPSVVAQRVAPQAFVPTSYTARLDPSATAPAPPDPGKEEPRATSGWGAMSWPRRAIVVLLLPTAALVVVSFFPEVVAPLGLGVPAATTPATHARTRADTPTVSQAPSVVAPSPSASAEPEAFAEKEPEEEPPLASSTPVAQESPRSKVDAKGRTLQRQAADAVASGAFDRAAEIYDALAKAYPDDPTYPAAAAIARSKAAGH